MERSYKESESAIVTTVVRKDHWQGSVALLRQGICSLSTHNLTQRKKERGGREGDRERKKNMTEN